MTQKDPKSEERIIDAKGQVLGRLASKVAYELVGKDSTDFMPSAFRPNNIKIINASKIKFTGDKLRGKLYKRYSGYHSGLKSTTLEDAFKRSPADVLRKAVWGMLPKNRLRKKFIKHLTITA